MSSRDPNPPKVPSRSGAAKSPHVDQRVGAANVARSQINHILGGGKQAGNAVQPMISREAAHQKNYTAKAELRPSTQNYVLANQASSDDPYDRTHAPTSHTAAAPRPALSPQQATEAVASEHAVDTALNTQRASSNEHVQSAVNQTVPAPDTSEKVRQYHAAWQNYYQKYYEKYYIAQLQNQSNKFAAGQAAVVTTNANTKTNDVLTQNEALEEIRTDLLSKVKQAGKRVRRSRHFWPIITALCAAVAIIFIQFNQIIFANVAAFVSPGEISDQNIIIGSGDSTKVGAAPKIIITKINVEAPVIYDLTSLKEEDVQKALQKGVVHYPLPGANSVPGQNGNSVFLGHSSGDLFEGGDYKFIFVQLSRMEPGDVFYLNYKGTRYTYEVTKKEIIAPNQLQKLNLGNKKPYATLITCDPPGTALKRLIVYGKQVSPDPDKAKTPASTTDTTESTDNSIPGNQPTLFEKIFGS